MLANFFRSTLGIDVDALIEDATKEQQGQLLLQARPGFPVFAKIRTCVLVALNPKALVFLVLHRLLCATRSLVAAQ